MNTSRRSFFAVALSACAGLLGLPAIKQAVASSRPGSGLIVTKYSWTQTLHEGGRMTRKFAGRVVYRADAEDDHWLFDLGKSGLLGTSMEKLHVRLSSDWCIGKATRLPGGYVMRDVSVHTVDQEMIRSVA